MEKARPPSPCTPQGGGGGTSVGRSKSVGEGGTSLGAAYPWGVDFGTYSVDGWGCSPWGVS